MEVTTQKCLDGFLITPATNSDASQKLFYATTQPLLVDRYPNAPRAYGTKCRTHLHNVHIPIKRSV